MNLTLYYHPLSSFCHKTLIALYELDLDFAKRFIDLASTNDRAELAALWPYAKFPVLRDGERIVAESTSIIEYLERYADTARGLIPADRETAFAARHWDRFCDLHVHMPMQRLVAAHAMGHDEAAADRTSIETAYPLLDRQLGSHTWLAGDRFTLADCSAEPALFYARTLVPFGEHAHVAAYFERLAKRPSVRRTLDEAKPWMHMYPLAERLEARFR